MSRRYAIGVDYGTLSGRAVLVDVDTGEEAAVAVSEYTHGVMDEALPGGTPLGRDWALQHPRDYLDVLRETIPKALAEAGAAPESVIGVGIDFTACTILPTDAKGEPLCCIPMYENHPHAYVKLWKHHAAQDEANRLNAIAEARGEAFLRRYGGKISSEWVVPKVWQMVNEAPHIYDAAARIIEATDWVVWRLTGVETRNSCTAGYKALWSKRDGFPSDDFFAALHPRLANFIDDKLGRVITPLGQKAGEITPEAAALTGLLPGTAVAVGNVDAHVSAPAVGAVHPGQMVMIMGTSTCHIMVGDAVRFVPGMCGVVEDGVVPGFAGYEAGQSCVGDHFDWFIRNCVPGPYLEAAAREGRGVQAYLTELAARQQPGESGLLALDWWNGNRSVLVDADVTGMLLGCTLATKPEDIYRALIEATAYGTRAIIEAFDGHGTPVTELFACGGIAEKNALMMQVYADVTRRVIKIGGSAQAPALGAAMFGALAAGKARGGFDDLRDAVAVMAKVKAETYTPIPENVRAYDVLYSEYKKLHDYFGRGENNVMKRLKNRLN